MDRKQHTKQCENVPDKLHNNPQDKVPTRRRPRKQERPQKCISGILPCRWDKNEDQTLTTQQPHELHKQMEPVTLCFHNLQSKGSGPIFELTTTRSNILFQIQQPVYMSWQPVPFIIFLRTPCKYICRGTLGKHSKFISIYGLNILTRSNAHFYFQPAPNYRNILIEEALTFYSVVRLRLNTLACCQSVLIPEGTYIGTLHPVLLTKHVEKQ